MAFFRFMILFSFWAAGCHRPSKPEAKPDEPVAAIPDKKDVPIKPVSFLKPLIPKSFNEATTQEPPQGVFRPPDRTMAGRSVGKMYEEIAGPGGKGGLWDKIVFTTSEGKFLRYQAEIQTELGNLVLDLWPEVAPNHVRNFIALAKVGYYDGLCFDRIETGEIRGQKFAFLEAGCPLGTGDPHYGSIGYWLKPEISDQVRHEEGTVGAWRSKSPDSAACKFYITLGKTPAELEGEYTIFGKVAQGLDLAHTISGRPVHEEDLNRPQEPMVIRQVLIRSTVVDSNQ